MDEYIIGQEEAKRILSVVYNHYKRITNSNQDKYSKNKYYATCWITGSGKTYIIKLYEIY